jgi:hypothetical protein
LLSCRTRYIETATTRRDGLFSKLELECRRWHLILLVEDAMNIRGIAGTAAFTTWLNSMGRAALWQPTSHTVLFAMANNFVTTLTSNICRV